jgi:hypothetical protein
MSVGILPPESIPDTSRIQTEDDTPVDGRFSEKQMRLLTEPLISSWLDPQGKKKVFAAMANVGLFYSPTEPPLVPDVMLSVGVGYPGDIHKKEFRSYFVWEYGKVPDVVIEIVSNREGGEDSRKLELYARIGINWYVLFDPEQHLSRGTLRFKLFGIPVRVLPWFWLMTLFTAGRQDTTLVLIWAAVVFASMPCGINAYLLAERYRTGVPATAGAVSLSTALSVFSISFWLWVLGVGLR